MGEVGDGVELESVLRQEAVDDAVAVPHVGESGRRRGMLGQILGVRVEHREEGERAPLVVLGRQRRHAVKDERKRRDAPGGERLEPLERAREERAISIRRRG
jgi:hypothetical protein